MATKKETGAILSYDCCTGLEVFFKTLKVAGGEEKITNQEKGSWILNPK